MTLKNALTGSVSIKNNRMTLTIPEGERLGFIQYLSNYNIVDDNGNINIEVFLEDNTGEVAVEEGVKNSPKKPEEIIVPLRGYIEDDIGEEDLLSYVVSGEEPADVRSIEDLSTREKQFLVTQYIRDVPTTVIMTSERVTKSALYSALERERIPRKGELNTIISKLVDEGMDPSVVAEEHSVGSGVIHRILQALEY